MEENKMKSIRKLAVSVIAGFMAAAALATTASAAEYFGCDGSYWYDGVNDGRMYGESTNGYWYEIDNTLGYYNYNNFGRFDDTVYVGCDDYYGDIYYCSEYGYFADRSDGLVVFGRDYTFTEYIGRDRSGRSIYYRDEIGYIYYSTDRWYSVGFNADNIAW